MNNIKDKTLQGTQTGSKTTERIFRGSKKRRARWKLVSFFLALAVVVLCLLTLTVGNTFYSLPEVFRVLTAGGGTDAMRFTILTLRLPRMICGLLAGLSFGVAGYLFQTILRNPLASPDIIGISSATSTAAVFCLLILNLPNSVVPAIAVLTGLLVTLLIYLLSVTNGAFSQSRMILIGIGVQAIANAFTNYLLSRAAEYDTAATLQWLSGSLSGSTMEKVPVFAVCSGVLFVVVALLRHQLPVILLGDAFATGLGVNLRKMYPALLASGVILTATATAITGPIASVAFLAGPIASGIAGRGQNNLLPSGLMGAVLVLGADLVGQNLLPARYPVGVITGLLGAPYLILILLRLGVKGR